MVRVRPRPAALVLALSMACAVPVEVSGEDTVHDDEADDEDADEQGDELSSDEDDEQGDASEDEGLKLDVGTKYDSQPEPPDPFPTAPLGCDEGPTNGGGEPLIDIDSAGAFLDPRAGLIRLRLIDEGPEHLWDIELDIPASEELPATHLGLPFVGYLSEPGLWEWWHGSIEGTVDLTVHEAEPDGCLWVELTASSNSWDQPAPPVGWVGTPLLPWPEDG